MLNLQARKRKYDLPMTWFDLLIDYASNIAKIFSSVLVSDKGHRDKRYYVNKFGDVI